MDKIAFEKALFTHLEKDSLVLTPIVVSATFGLDTGDAANLLEALVADGKLELISGAGNTAKYKQLGKATYGTTPGEQSVKPPVKDGNVIQLVLNFVFPGLGSLMGGNWVFGVIPIVLFFALSIVLLVVMDDFNKFYAAIPLAVAWIWSIVVGFYDYFGPKSLKK